MQRQNRAVVIKEEKEKKAKGMIAGDEPSAKRIKSEITNGHDAEAETSMHFFSIIVLFFSFKSFVT